MSRLEIYFHLFQINWIHKWHEKLNSPALIGTHRGRVRKWMLKAMDIADNIKIENFIDHKGILTCPPKMAAAPCQD